MFSSLFNKKSDYFGIKTFTYFIPAPPDRRTGYQEKEFDSIINSLGRMGFEVLDVKTCAYANELKAGMWIVCLLGAKSKDVYDKEVLFDSGEGLNLDVSKNVPIDPDIIHD